MNQMNPGLGAVCRRNSCTEPCLWEKGPFMARSCKRSYLTLTEPVAGVGPDVVSERIPGPAAENSMKRGTDDRFSQPCAGLNHLHVNACDSCCLLLHLSWSKSSPFHWHPVNKRHCKHLVCHSIDQLGEYPHQAIRGNSNTKG